MPQACVHAHKYYFDSKTLDNVNTDWDSQLFLFPAPVIRFATKQKRHIPHKPRKIPKFTPLKRFQNYFFIDSKFMGRKLQEKKREIFKFFCRFILAWGEKIINMNGSYIDQFEI